MRNGFIKYVFVTWAFFSLNSINAQILTFDHGEIEFYTATAVSDIDAVFAHKFLAYYYLL